MIRPFSETGVCWALSLLAPLGAAADPLPAGRVPLGFFLGRPLPTLLQQWGLILVVLAVLAFAAAWRLMRRRK